MAVGWAKDRTELSELRTQVTALRDDLTASEEQLELRRKEHLEEANELKGQNRLLEIRLYNAGKQNDAAILNRP